MTRYANPPFVAQHQFTTIPVEKQSAAYKLFNNRYACVTAQMNLYSKEYLSAFGVVTTGDKECDEAMAHSTVNIWLTPAGMAVMLKESQIFGLTNHRDSVEIYELLIEHLTDWKRFVQREINAVDIPFDDLHAFEQLAIQVFEVAKGFMTNPRQLPNDQFFRNTGVMRGIRRAGPGQTPDAAKPLVREHTPIVDDLRKEVMTNNQPNRKIPPWR